MAWSPAKMQRLLEDLVALDPETATLTDFLDLRERAIEVRDFGRRDNLDAGREVAIRRRKERAKALDAQVYPIIRRMRYEDKMSVREIADALNGMHIASPTGRGWGYSTVTMIFHRNGDKGAS